MKFCKVCHNMLHEIKESEEGGGISLKCRYCNSLEAVPSDSNIVYEHNLRQDRSVQYSITSRLEKDPTLPRFTDIKCPSCKKTDVVGVKLDPVDVLWMYRCVECSETWKQRATG